MSISRIATPFILLSALFSGLASALPEDKSQPIHIAADSANMNELTGITVYKGAVNVQQGTLKIEGSTVELKQKNGGVTNIKALGSPAHYEQKPNKQEPLTHAYGNKLDYDTTAEILVITGKAKVTQGGDVFTGDRIVYNMKKSTIEAFSDDKSSNERVIMVIQPKATQSGDKSSEKSGDN